MCSAAQQPASHVARELKGEGGRWEMNDIVPYSTQVGHDSDCYPRKVHCMYLPTYTFTCLTTYLSIHLGR